MRRPVSEPQALPQLTEKIDDLISLVCQRFTADLLIPPDLAPVPCLPREPLPQTHLNSLSYPRVIDRNRASRRGQSMNQTTRTFPVPLLGQGTGPVEHLVRPV